MFKLSRMELEDNVDLFMNYMENGRSLDIFKENQSDLIGERETTILSTIKIDQASYKTKYPTFELAKKKIKNGGRGSIQYKIDEYEDEVVYCPPNPSKYVCLINCLLKAGIDE